MKTTFTRFVCRVLVASLIVLPLQAQAELIGTGEAVSAAQARAAATAQLQAMGLSPQAARERVTALTDAEAAALAERIDQLPAGAFGGQALGFLIVLIFLLWRFQFSDQAKAEAATAAKPKPEAAKPKPEPKK